MYYNFCFVGGLRFFIWRHPPLCFVFETNEEKLFLIIIIDFQKLEREARICRRLQHPNIGE